MEARSSPLAAGLGDAVGVRIVAAAKGRINRVLPRAVAQSNDDAATGLVLDLRQRRCTARFREGTHA
jgi:hypothetical protein